MKIAIVADGHTGSTFPLAKYLCKAGHACDFYIISFLRKIIVEGSDCQIYPHFPSIIKIKRKKCPLLYNYYMGIKNLHLYSICIVLPLRKLKIFNKILQVLQNIQIKYICQRLDNEKYDCINFVGRYNVEYFTLFLKYLKTKSVIVSLHEVINHANENYTNISPLLHELFKKNIHIIVYSQNSYNDIIKYPECNPKKVNIIPFGLFESFKLLGGHTTLQLPDKYLLFVGSIKPYKGLNILYDAICPDDKFLKEFKIVIAGKGQDPVLLHMKHNSRFICIDKFLTNFEFAELIERAYCVICPYTSGSQSGIPQTTFIFNTPIIASNIDAFSEIIHNDNYGILFNVNDSIDLRNTIKYIIENPSMIKKYKNNIKQFSNISIQYSWENIATKYLKLINDIA